MSAFGKPCALRLDLPGTMTDVTIVNPVSLRIQLPLLITGLLVALAAVFATGGAAHAGAVAPPGIPPAGKVMLGVAGSEAGPPQFNRLTGATHELHLVSINWNESREGGWHYAIDSRFRDAKRGNYRLMIHVAPNKDNQLEGRSPGAVARGAADRYLLDLGAVVNERDEYVYIRPPAEMNGHWSVWAAYNKNGTQRNADHSTTNYRKAFIRMALIVRGGSVATINRALRANGMPALATSKAELPASGKVALVFNPQGRGAPDVAGNMPAAYYPGKAYVDYVANDVYEQGGKANWAAHEALYQRYAKAHPFIVAEFAPWGYDGASFVKKMFAWTAAHPRTVGLIYYNGSGSSIFRLAGKPRSVAAYKAAARAPRYRCAGLSGTNATC
ncbi:MAG: Beta-mannanase-like [Thermoleophilia bacterium]|nr:Beta-mannanase-like [Thermoleophilia bacterium]